MALSQQQRAEVERILQEFLAKTVDRIADLDVGELNINPFLMRLLSSPVALSGPREIINFLLTQRLERGAVTSFGSALKKIARVFSCAAYPQVDVVARRNGQESLVIVASGPWTFDKAQARSTVGLMKTLRAEHPGSEVVLGLCYGRAGSISNLIRHTVETNGGFRVVSGAAFWTLISGDAGCADEVFAIAESISKQPQGVTGKSLDAAVAKKAIELSQALQASSAPATFWDHLLHHNI